jgi:hypothetical protein
VTTQIDAALVVANLAGIHARIAAAGGDPSRITVVAVTKAFGPDAAAAAFEAGLADLGENYAAELVEKASLLGASGPGAPRWHYLGAVQRNKVARLAPFVALWQSVDRAEEGETIARHAPGAAVLVEVDSTHGSAGRGGVAPDEVAPLVDRLRSFGLEVRGLMTVAPLAPEDASAAPKAFGALRSLADELGLAEVSMGMSDDLEAAVAEGTTMVRVGRALFGPRPGPGRVSQ